MVRFILYCVRLEWLYLIHVYVEGLACGGNSKHVFEFSVPPRPYLGLCYSVQH